MPIIMLIEIKNDNFKVKLSLRKFSDLFEFIFIQNIYMQNGTKEFQQSSGNLLPFSNY